MQDSKPGVPVWMGENSKCAEEAQGTAASPFNLLSLCDQAAAAADYGHFYFKPDEGAPEEGPGTCILLVNAPTCTLQAGDYTVYQTANHMLPLTEGKDDVWFCTLRNGNELDQAFELSLIHI